MDIYDMIALTIKANGGMMNRAEIIQKLVYFNTAKISNLKICSFNNYFFGPYSGEIALTIDEMFAFSYLNKILSSNKSYNNSYYLTERGEQYANKAKTKYSTEYEIISSNVRTCKGVCKLESEPLSYASKAHHILTRITKDGESDKYTKDDVKRIAENFDWDVTKETAIKGIKLLQKLDLCTA